VRKKKLRGETGATLVEFAIASTILFLLIFAAVGFSQVLTRSMTISNASKAAVRWAAVRGSTSGQTPATESDVHDFIVTKMNGISETDSTTWNPTTKAVGSVVTVVVRSSYTFRVPLLGTFTRTLRSSSQMEILR
jgi:Flp pilus assembly protein TadG